MKTGGRHMKMRIEIRVTNLQAKELQRLLANPQKRRGVWDRASLTALRKNQPC